MTNAAPTTWQEAAVYCEYNITELSIALSGEVAHRTQIADARDSMKRAETRATLNPEIDGKNEAASRAQIEAKMLEDGDYRTAYETARQAERELAEEAGPSATALGHGLVVIDDKGPVFIATKPNAAPVPPAIPCPVVGCDGTLRWIAWNGKPTDILVCPDCFAYFGSRADGCGGYTLTQAELVG